MHLRGREGDCEHLFSKYKAIPFEQTGMLNALETAEFIGDRITVRRRKPEACEVTARQRAAREALVDFRSDQPAVSSVNRSFS